MNQETILTKLSMVNGLPKRTLKTWKFVLRTCWKNIFEQEIKNIEEGCSYTNGHNSLYLGFTLPPVENENSHFKNDSFFIALLACDIQCKMNIRKLLKAYKFHHFDFKLNYYDGVFYFTIKLDANEEIIFSAKKLYLYSLYIKKINDKLYSSFALI